MAISASGVVFANMQCRNSRQCRSGFQVIRVFGGLWVANTSYEFDGGVARGTMCDLGDERRRFRGRSIPACSAKTSSAWPGLTFQPPPPEREIMISWLLLVLRASTGMARSRGSLAVENAVLHYQLAVLQRERPRPLLRPADRVLWIWLCRHWNRWRHALVLIQPATKRHNDDVVKVGARP